MHDRFHKLMPFSVFLSVAKKNQARSRFPLANHSPSHLLFYCTGQKSERHIYASTYAAERSVGGEGEGHCQEISDSQSVSGLSRERGRCLLKVLLLFAVY